MITVEEIEKEIILMLRLDNETAHSHEDWIHEEVLRTIAMGTPNAQELATAALKTNEVKFERWYS